MQAVFIRHSMSSTDEIIDELWSKRLIAVYFENKPSTKPEDYDSAGKKALERLGRCCKSGAIVGVAVGAKFKVHSGSMLVGEIESGSKVEAKDFGGFIYKTVQLKNAREVYYRDYPLLAAIQPRLTTITDWPSAQKYLEAILGKEKVPCEVGSLHPSQLEVICYEYLRMKKVLSNLLMPIGRTLQDVDIVGIDSQGKNIFAQVTGSTHHKEIEKKIDKLKSYKSEDSALIFFGPKSQEKRYENIQYISIEDVFKVLTEDPESSCSNMIHKMLRW